MSELLEVEVLIVKHNDRESYKWLAGVAGTLLAESANEFGTNLECLENFKENLGVLAVRCVEWAKTQPGFFTP